MELDEENELALAIYDEVMTQLNYDVHLAPVVLAGRGYPAGARRTNEMIYWLNVIHREMAKKETEPKAATVGNG